MEKEKELTTGVSIKNNLKTGAKVSLVVLLFSIIRQFISVYEARYKLTSPFIPESTIWIIIKLYIFIAFISTIASIAGLILYYYEKYLWLIILVGLTLIGQQIYPFLIVP